MATRLNTHHLEALQSSDIHHVVGGFWNNAHHFQCSLQILCVLASTFRVLQDILQYVQQQQELITKLRTILTT